MLRVSSKRQSGTFLAGFLFNFVDKLFSHEWSTGFETSEVKGERSDHCDHSSVTEVKFNVFSLGLKLRSEQIAALSDLTDQHMRELDSVKEAHRKTINVGSSLH
jgi:hypothetical protein